MKNKFEQGAVILLRIVVGFGFAMHGYAKLANGPDHFVANLQALGVPAPELMGWVTIILELVGGLAVMIGAILPIVTLPLAMILLTAAFTVHLQYGFSSIKLKEVTPAGAVFGPPGYEMDVLYLAALAVIALSGPGPLSLDGYLKGRKEGRA